MTEPRPDAPVRETLEFLAWLARYDRTAAGTEAERLLQMWVRAGHERPAPTE